MKMKGLVLAAGLGTRLRPLTERWPKPLVPFAGTTPLDLALWRLRWAGIKENAVNSHHMASAIEHALKGNDQKPKVKISFEPEILGTGGVYNPLRTWFDGADVAVLNGDVISDIDLGALVKFHRHEEAAATMALLPKVIPGESAVFHENGRVIAIGKDTPRAGVAQGNFACAQILAPAFLELLPKAGAFDIISNGYQVALSKGLKIAAWIHDGIWHDLRTPRFYWEALCDLVTDPRRTERVGITALREARGLKTKRKGGLFFDDSCVLGAEVQTKGVVILEPGARVGEKASLENVVVLSDGIVAAGEMVRQTVRGDRFSVAF